MLTWSLCQRPLIKKKIKHHTKRRILRDKRDKAYNNMKTVDNNPYSAMYVIYFNPSPSISPPKTSISIEVHRRWNQAFFPDVYTRGHSADWCPRQTRCSFRVFTPFTDSIIPLPSTATPDLWGRASEIRFRLISPGGKKNVHSPLRIRAHKGASHSSRTTHAVGHLWKGKERKKAAPMDMIMGMPNTISDISYCCHVGQIIRL